MSNKDLSPLGYEQVVQHRGGSSYVKYGIIAVIVLVLCGVSFGLGVNHQKSKQTTASVPSASDTGQLPPQGGGRGGGMGGFRGGQRPNIGEVKSVTSDSITVTNQRTGSDQTFKITSNTTVQNNGSTASVGDIKTGDTVLITADSSDTTTAAQITLNANFGGGQPMSAPQPTTNTEAESI